EYKVTIKDARSGQTIGVPSTLKFLGENPVIDRRSIVFTGSKKKKKEQEEEPQEQAEDSAPSEESTADEDLGDADEPETEGNQPPSVDERPGGGCQHSPGEPAPLGGLALGLLFALVL